MSLHAWRGVTPSASWRPEDRLLLFLISRAMFHSSSTNSATLSWENEVLAWKKHLQTHTQVLTQTLIVTGFKRCNAQVSQMYCYLRQTIKTAQCWLNMNVENLKIECDWQTVSVVSTQSSPITFNNCCLIYVYFYSNAIFNTHKKPTTTIKRGWIKVSIKEDKYCLCCFNVKATRYIL